MVGQTSAGPGDPGFRDRAMRHRGDMVGVPVEHVKSRLTHRQGRRAHRVLDLPNCRGDVVGGRLSGDGDEFVQRPAAGVGQHRLLHHLRVCIHQAHGVDRARRPRDRMRVGHRPARGFALPRLRMLALERIDAAPIGGAGRIPEASVRERRKRMRMKAESGVETIVIAMSGVHGLRSAHLLGRFAEIDERPFQPVRLHRMLSRQKAAKRADAERRMRVGVAGGAEARSVARLSSRLGRLALPGHGVIFGIAGERRSRAVRPPRSERSRHSGRSALDLKTLAREPVHVPGRRFVLAPRRLMEIPDRHVIG